MIRLVVPSLNLDVEISNRKSDLPTYGLNYVSLGQWEQPKSGSTPYSLTAFSFGYETPNAAMPHTGTAVFAGFADGTVLKPVGGSIRATYLHGKANFSVDFGSGNITGAMTQMQEYGTGAVPWNDVSVTANITGSTNKFSGSTAASSSPNTTLGLAGSAIGHIDGAFYGPNAEQLGAVWSLSDGIGSALGTVGAARQ